MTKIYTKTGDNGTTSLATGERVSKADPRVEIYGTIDELSSNIGVVVSFLSNKSVFTYVHKFLIKIQRDLFLMGSVVASTSENREKRNIVPIEIDAIEEMEKKIDSMQAELTPIDKFIIPGGHSAAAWLHISRTIARRAERLMVGFNDENPNEIPAEAVMYINRLADYLFVLSRYVNRVKHVTETCT